MSQLFSLICPTCGATLQVAGERDQFHCAHCGNRYLLDHRVAEIQEAARSHLVPAITYTQTLGQWLRVAEYDLRLHCMETSTLESGKVFHIDVAYENKSGGPLKYRYDQWTLFDKDGYSFEPVKDFTHEHLYAAGKIYLGLTRVLSPGMKLRGWLAFLLPGSSQFEYLQFSGGTPIKTVEFRISE